MQTCEVDELKRGGQRGGHAAVLHRQLQLAPEQAVGSARLLVQPRGARLPSLQASLQKRNGLRRCKTAVRYIMRLLCYAVNMSVRLRTRNLGERLMHTSNFQFIDTSAHRMEN